MRLISSVIIVCCVLHLTTSVRPRYGFGVRDADHLKYHLPRTVDASHMADRELLFHFFQVNDIDGNNALDGCELIQSLLHFHSEATAHHGAPPRLFEDSDLAEMVDALLERDDRNLDGFVDYSEFLEGEINIGF